MSCRPLQPFYFIDELHDVISLLMDRVESEKATRDFVRIWVLKTSYLLLPEKWSKKPSLRSD